jgi:hypothetical protein
MAAAIHSADTRPALRAAPEAVAGAESDAAITAPALPVAPSADSSWARGLAARIDAQLAGDFGTDTPVVAPTKAELQALLDVPPDATRELSFDEVERLHRQKEARRSEPELELTRRAHYPTAEVREEDIEAAIEIAPSARRTGSIGIAKVKPKPDEP